MGRPVVHFEINSPKGVKLHQFYADLFDWHVESIPANDYGLIDTHAGKGINGGIGQTEGERFVTVYVEVPDPQAYLDRATQLGAKVIAPVTEIPGQVTFALFADPDGNQIGLVKEEEPRSSA